MSKQTLAPEARHQIQAAADKFSAEGQAASRAWAESKDRSWAAFQATHKKAFEAEAALIALKTKLFKK